MKETALAKGEALAALGEKKVGRWLRGDTSYEALRPVDPPHERRKASVAGSDATEPDNNMIIVRRVRD